MVVRLVALVIVALLWSTSSPAQSLEVYAGTYQVSPDVKLTVSLDGDHLMGQLAGFVTAPLEPISGGKFRFAQNVQVEFLKDENGVVTHALLSQNGQGAKAQRLRDRKEITLSVETLKPYAGRYGRQTGLDLIITLEGNRLVAESTGQFKLPLLAESETSFFFKDVDAQIEFVKDNAAAVDHLVLKRGRVHETVKRSAVSLPVPKGTVAPSKLPAKLSDEEFWKIITDFSEPNGFYRFENFVSNEDDYQTVLPELKRSFNPDSIFVGVGPEQNLT